VWAGTLPTPPDLTCMLHPAAQHRTAHTATSIRKRTKHLAYRGVWRRGHGAVEEAPAVVEVANMPNKHHAKVAERRPVAGRPLQRGAEQVLRQRHVVELTLHLATAAQGCHVPRGELKRACCPPGDPKLDSEGSAQAST